MKIKYQILISLIFPLLIADVATAQKQTSEKRLLAPQVSASSLSKSEVQKLVTEEFERGEYKNELKIRERVQDEVDRSFGWTIGLIQLLLGVLAALPIFAGFILFFSRDSIKNQIVEESKNQVKEKLDLDVKTALKDFDDELKSETLKKTNELNLEFLNRRNELTTEFTKRMDELLIEVVKRKDYIVEEMNRLVPETPTKEATAKSSDPEVLARVQELTTTLKVLQDRYPELALTAGDYFKKGNALYYETLYEEAIVAYEKAIELKPDNPNAWYNKGTALVDLQRYEEALVAYEKATELKPDKLEAWNNKGVTLGKLQRFEEALTAYEKAIELEPDDSDVWYNKACLHSLTGSSELAIQALKHSIDLNVTYREEAKTDSDFDNIRDDQEFKQLIEDI